MAKHGTHQPIPEEAIEREHEQRDLSIGVLTAGLVGLVVLTGGAILAMALYLGWYQSAAARSAEAPMPVGPAEVVPPQPRLENTPAEVRLRHEANVEQIMNSYGWLERDASVARIPVARAMEIVAREGLPVAAAPATAETESGTERD